MRAMIRLVLFLVLFSGAARAEDLMAAVRADHWAAAAAAAETYADPVVPKLVEFYRLLAPGGGRLAEIAAFIDANPDWPQQATLVRRRDEALLLDPDDVAVAALCDDAHPAEARALERCAEAFDELGRHEDAVRTARRGWIASVPDPARDAAVLLRWTGVIGPAEQRARFDELAWTDTAGASRQAAMLDPADQPEAEALLALRRDDTRASLLLSILPEADRATPAMMLETAKWLRRANRDNEALELWETRGGPAEQAAPAEHLSAFWDERNLLLRRRLHDGDATGAYALADGARQVAPEPVADAAFIAGWIALRRLSDPALALTHFRQLAALSRAAQTRSRGEYWIGRAATAAGDAAAARTAFVAAAAYPSTFYGQLAGSVLGNDAAVADAIRARADPPWTADQALAFSGREQARAAAYLVAWGEPRRSAVFLLRLTELGGEPSDLSLAARLATGFGMPESAVAIARRAGRDGTVLLGTGWPVGVEVPPGSPVEAPLVLAIIRQESSFDTATLSPVGARGLMQLMPGTAAAQAKALNVPETAGALVTDPALNVKLGSAYLRTLMDRYDGAVPLAVAAYNAGPSRVDGWLAANGDPRTGPGAGTDMIDWIELIGFAETRNYVERAVENMVVYRALLRRTGPNPLRAAAGPA